MLAGSVSLIGGVIGGVLSSNNSDNVSPSTTYIIFLVLGIALIVIGFINCACSAIREVRSSARKMQLSIDELNMAYQSRGVRFILISTHNHYHHQAEVSDVSLIDVYKSFFY